MAVNGGKDGENPDRTLAVDFSANPLDVTVGDETISIDFAGELQFAAVNRAIFSMART